MNANFPDGYKIIVYVGGDSNNNGWSLTLNEGVTHTGFDKATGTTYFGKTRYNPNALVDRVTVGRIMDTKKWTTVYLV